jgi:cation diffusion facilitator CzcD-associated flavoprotein CzcO
MSGKLGRRAVVVGAGTSGLSAAGVLAKYFDQIDILERDQTRYPLKHAPARHKTTTHTACWLGVSRH